MDAIECDFYLWFIKASSAQEPAPDRSLEGSGTKPARGFQRHGLELSGTALLAAPGTFPAPVPGLVLLRGLQGSWSPLPSSACSSAELPGPRTGPIPPKPAPTEGLLSPPAQQQ